MAGPKTIWRRPAAHLSRLVGGLATATAASPINYRPEPEPRPPTRRQI